jgi:phospholipid/cholesterol/gamma-HCH transport system substrate-binding protein
MSQTFLAGRGRLARVAGTVLAAAMLLSGCEFSVYSLPLPGGADLGDDPYAVRVKFRDVLDLVPQSAVKVNDVTVGMVDAVELDGYTAEVTLKLRDDVELPGNAEAEIRQTSLLGEKFVSLKPPKQGASSDRLGDGDVIPLQRSGRNPEVEEVLGALSLLLNGGGVAQLKTIASELNKALEGREGDVRSVLRQLETFMAQLDENKDDIIEAIESLNDLAVSINEQRGSIELALDEMPAALASIDRQRDDLVKMLDALTELSAVGTRVIRASKTATVDSLQQLDPILTKLAEAGDALPKAFQVFLTYPFVDAVVGRNPVQARNLHMGDYTNLSVQMDIDLRKGPPMGADDVVETIIDECGQLPADELTGACEELLDQAPIDEVCKLGSAADLPLCRRSPGGGDGGNGDDDGGGLLGDALGGSPSGVNRDRDGSSEADAGSGDSGCLLPPMVCRTSPGFALGAPTTAEASPPSTGPDGANGYDRTLGALLVQGMV